MSSLKYQIKENNYLCTKRNKDDSYTVNAIHTDEQENINHLIMLLDWT